MCLSGYITFRLNGSLTPWKNLAVFGGARLSHKFDCFWKASYLSKEKVFQKRKMPWTVFGGARTSVIWTLMNVYITSKRNDSLTPRNELGRDKGCWGARPSHKLESLTWPHNIQTSRFFNIVIRTGPCLSEHDQPFIWTFMKNCITSKRNDSSTPQNELGCDRDIGERGPAINLNVSKRLHNI